MPIETDVKFGEMLVRLGFLEENKLAEALKVQKETKKKLGEILLEWKLIDENQLIIALSEIYHLPVIDLTKITVDPEIRKLVPPRVFQKYNVLPVALQNDYLVVAMNDPLDLAMLQELKNLSGKKIRPVLATSVEIRAFFDNPMFAAEEVIREASDIKERAVPAADSVSVKELELAAQEAPTVRLVASVISEAIKNKASDIHFEPQRESMRVRFRIDGVLYEKTMIPSDMQAAIISRIKIIAGMDISENRKPQDGRMEASGDGKQFDIRVSSLPSIFGEKLVLRLLNKQSIILPLSSLGMNEGEMSLISELAKRPYGMVLVSGPTGSGKTTTLYSLLNSINNKEKNIVTVEDPVEYELNGITQTAVNTRAGYSFATAIRHILRQDPDIIMIGEIRDLETAEIAIQAALTGHLVLSTIHTNNAAGVVTRLIDMNVEPFLVSSAVVGVIAQRLVRTLCPVCRKGFRPSEDMKKNIPDLAAFPEDTVFAAPVGCPECNSLGYNGRTGVFEMFALEAEVRNLILSKSNEAEISKSLLSRNMKTLRSSGLDKARRLITSIEEVMRITFVEKD